MNRKALQALTLVGPTRDNPSCTSPRRPTIYYKYYQFTSFTITYHLSPQVNSHGIAAIPKSYFNAHHLIPYIGQHIR